jgi:hypothetical protein
MQQRRMFAYFWIIPLQKPSENPKVKDEYIRLVRDIANSIRTLPATLSPCTSSFFNVSAGSGNLRATPHM